MAIDLKGFQKTMQRLPPLSSPLLLAFSGGVDSVVLGHLLHQSGHAFVLAHCNFQLREQAAEEDEAFAIAMGEKWNVPVYTSKCPVAPAQRQIKRQSGRNMSVQMAARALRYTWFQELQQKHGFEALLTAHHLNDQIETLLLNLIRGTGLDGLCGMEMLRLQPSLLFRPLLSYRKADILAYANAEQLQWREDTSNKDITYKRNFVRQKLVPLFEEQNPSFLSTTSQTVARLRDGQALMQAQLGKAQQHLLQEREDGHEIDLAELKSWPGPVETLYHLLASWGFAYAQCTSMVQQASSPGARFESPTHRALIDRKNVLIRPKKKRTQINEKFSDLDSLQRWPGWKTELLSAPLEKLPKNSALGLFDAATLVFPLVLRNWQSGDRFQPLGMPKGHQKVSDLLINEQVNGFDKEEVLVLVSGEEIIWVVGVRIAAPHKVTPKTRRVLQITPQASR